VDHHEPPERYNALRGVAGRADLVLPRRRGATSAVEWCLTGAGERAFSSGGDMKQAQETGTSVYEFGFMEASMFRVSSDPKPVIAPSTAPIAMATCSARLRRHIGPPTAQVRQTGPRRIMDAGWGTATWRE